MNGEPVIPPGSRAVLIGVPNYQDARYRSYTAVANSVEGMYRLLVESGLCGWRKEQVEKITNPTNAGQLIGWLRRLAAETTGVLLLYFVGHGQPSKHGELCLAIADTDYANPDSTGVEYTKIKRMLHEETPAATRIVILDCCYSGTVVGLGPNDLANLSTCAGAYTLTAADEVAQVRADDHSSPRTAFTGELLDLLRLGILGCPPGLTLGTIFPLLRQRLADKGLPRPNQRSDDSVAAFVFARNAVYVVPTRSNRPDQSRIRLKTPPNTATQTAKPNGQQQPLRVAEHTHRESPGTQPLGPQPSINSQDRPSITSAVGSTGPRPVHPVVYRPSPRQRAYLLPFLIIGLACLGAAAILGYLSLIGVLSVSGSQALNIASFVLDLSGTTYIVWILWVVLNTQLILTQDGVHLKHWKYKFARWCDVNSVLVEDTPLRGRRVRFVLADKSMISPVPVETWLMRDREFDQKVSTIQEWRSRFGSP